MSTKLPQIVSNTNSPRLSALGGRLAFGAVDVSNGGGDVATGADPPGRISLSRSSRLHRGAFDLSGATAIDTSASAGGQRLLAEPPTNRPATSSPSQRSPKADESPREPVTAASLLLSLTSRTLASRGLGAAPALLTPSSPHAGKAGVAVASRTPAAAAAGGSSAAQRSPGLSIAHIRGSGRGSSSIRSETSPLSPTAAPSMLTAAEPGLAASDANSPGGPAASSVENDPQDSPRVYQPVRPAAPRLKQVGRDRPPNSRIRPMALDDSSIHTIKTGSLASIGSLILLQKNAQKSPTETRAGVDSVTTLATGILAKTTTGTASSLLQRRASLHPLKLGDLINRHLESTDPAQPLVSQSLPVTPLMATSTSQPHLSLSHDNIGSYFNGLYAIAEPSTPDSDETPAGAPKTEKRDEISVAVKKSQSGQIQPQEQPRQPPKSPNESRYTLSKADEASTATAQHRSIGSRLIRSSPSQQHIESMLKSRDALASSQRRDDMDTTNLANKSNASVQKSAETQANIEGKGKQPLAKRQPLSIASAARIVITTLDPKPVDHQSSSGRATFLDVVAEAIAKKKSPPQDISSPKGKQDDSGTRRDIRLSRREEPTEGTKKNRGIHSLMSQGDINLGSSISQYKTANLVAETLKNSEKIMQMSQARMMKRRLSMPVLRDAPPIEVPKVIPLSESEEAEPIENEPSKSNETLKQSVKNKRLWMLAHACFILGSRLARVYKQVTRKIQMVQLAPAVENSGLAFMLRTHQTTGDSTFSSKVREALDVSRERTKDNIESLERALTIRLRSFARFTLNQRLQFCEIMQYERFEKDSLLVKEGHVSLAFYFILNGQVEIFKVKDNLKYRINVLNSGDSFGDRTMNMLNDKRTACVGTTMDTELLKVDKADFFKIANYTDAKNITNRIVQLSSISMLAASDSGFLEKSAVFFKHITYEPNETILYEGTDNLDLFWILKGSCKCVKIVPFVQKRYKVGHSSTKVHIRPHVANISVADDEQVIEQILSVQELSHGDFFPDIPMDPKLADEFLMPSTFQKNQYIDFLSNLDPASEHTKAYVSIIANSKIEVMAIPRIDYCKLASPRMVFELLNQKHQFRTSVSDLQESYMQQRNWQMYKKKVVGEVLTKTK